ncbi:hypothetical protein WMF30_40815 [Sorangium sp. So ce134]
MNRLKISAFASAMMLPTLLLPGTAGATAIDSAFTWSITEIIVGDVGAGSDNDIYVTFRNMDGSQHVGFWNSAGTEICNNNPTLRLSRARTNFKEMLEVLNVAGLSGKKVWVGYEPVGGQCYLKTVSVFYR